MIDPIEKHTNFHWLPTDRLQMVIDHSTQNIHTYLGSPALNRPRVVEGIFAQWVFSRTSFVFCSRLVLKGFVIFHRFDFRSLTGVLMLCI